MSDVQPEPDSEPDPEPGSTPASEGVPADAPATARRWPAVVARVAAVAAWCFVAALVWTAASVWSGTTWPSQLTVLLQSLVPLLFLPVWVLAPLAWWRHRRALAVACLALVLVHVILVVPAMGSRSTPGWVAAAPRLTVLSANVYDGNPDPAAAIASVFAQDADVMILVEMPPAFVAALDAAGVASKYPYRFVGTFGPTTDNVEGVYSKLPLTAPHDIAVGRQIMHTAQVAVGGVPLELLSVHVNSAVHDRGEWTRELGDLRDHSQAANTALALLGDFNATRWSPPFHDLLGAGLSDAHESTGNGLTFSWPNTRLPFAVMRLDHALLNAKVAAVHLRDIDVAGSDHKGFVVELAVRR